MKALRFHGRRDLRLEEVPAPEAGPDQLRIQVTAAGLSQTQIGEFMEGPFIISPGEHPFTGHAGPIIPCQEYGGIVDQVGPGVDRELLGAQVAALPLISCGDCRACGQGRENLCERLAYRGLVGADGGFCDYSVVDAGSAFPVAQPEFLTLLEPLLVGVHASKRLTRPPDGPVAIVGAGAVGCAIAAVWRDCLGWDVVVHDLLPERLRRAAAMGLPTLPQPPGPASYDVVVDAAGKDVVQETEALVEAVAWCRPGGTVVSVGMYFSPLSLLPADLTATERTIAPSFVYDSSDVDDLRDWLGKISTDFSPIISFVPLDDLVEDGYYQAEIDKDSFTRIVTRGDV